ncbi:MAG: ROK family protein [Dehalococcoidia bacterium]|nr:ROK family protein [Dehalococcoidia bacterium]
MSDDEPQQEPIAALVAVDFTADELRLLLTTPSQELIANERWPLPQLDDETAWAWEVGGRISTIFARDGAPLYALGIGVACPGFVDPTRGVIIESRAQQSWDDLHVVDSVRRHIDAPTVALDRAQAALRGEMTLGAAIGHNDVLYVSASGDGPSAAILIAGTVVRGAHQRPGLAPPADEDGTIDLEVLAAWIGDAAALLDTAIVILQAPEEQAEALLAAVHEAAAGTGAMAEIVVSELGGRAALFGALDAAAIVSYEGERDA